MSSTLHPLQIQALWRRQVGQRFRQVRQKLGLTQHVMAHRLDLSTSTVNILETGKVRLEATVKQHMTHAAKVLAVDLGWLLNGDTAVIAPPIPLRSNTMHNEQTYYAVLVSYPMPAFLSAGITTGTAIPEVMDCRFFTRATTYADLYLDLRRFAIDRRLEELNATGDGEDEVTDLPLEELEGLISPTINKLVAIDDPEVCSSISKAWDSIEQLEDIGTAAYTLCAGTNPHQLAMTAGKHRLDLEQAVKALIRCHLVENPEPKQYMDELYACSTAAYQFFRTLRTPVEQPK